MRVQKRNPWLTGLGMVLAVIALSGVRAGADVASDQAGSVVIFPKVIADGTRDTLISLTNTTNMQAFVHCEYVQGAGICETSPVAAPVFCTPINAAGASTDCTAVPGERCLVSWQSQDFDLILTRQQPTIWRVSTGRIQDLFADADGECDNVVIDDVERQICPGYFITVDDPLNPSGNVTPPPGAPFFRGELKCFQTDSTITSLNAGDALKGEAIIGYDPDSPLASPQISKYNSINIQGELGSPDDLILKLNQTPNRAAEDRGEFNACPEALEFTGFSPGAENETANALAPAACTMTGCPVRTEVTVIPCSEDFEREEGSRVILGFQFYDEFERLQNSFSPELDCWATYDLADLTTVTDTTTFWKTRITPQGTGRCREGNLNAVCGEDAECGFGGVCGPVSGILAVVEEFYDSDASLTPMSVIPAGSAAFNTTMVNDPNQGNDADVVRSGSCRGQLGVRCESDMGCPIIPGRTLSGICRNSDTDCDDDDDCAGPGRAICDICMSDEIIFAALE